MSRFAFDTHAFVKRLTRAGMDEQQAEALVECQTQLINDSLATKQDMEEVKLDIEEVKRGIQEVKLDIEEVKRDIQEVKLDIEEVKRDIQKVKLDIEEVKKNIDTLRLETKKDIATLKTDMQKMELRLTLRLGSVIVVTMGVFATLVNFLPYG